VHSRPIIRRIDEAPGHPEILRIVAPNPGPLTLEGTNTYVVGRDPAYVIDPGPAIDSHVEAVRAAGDERGGIGGILLTHSHSDHSAAAPALGAPLLVGAVSEGDEMAAPAGGVPPNGRSATKSRYSEREVGPFTALPSPGHASDHVCFVLDAVCFCGDLILGHGSSIVPPASMGGSLSDYMDSLLRVRELDSQLLCPGHGPWITDPATKIDEYIAHRREREAKLVAALDAGERSRERLLDAAWDDVPDGLRPAAAAAMEAHLEKLTAEGRLPDGVEPEPTA
jgi:glyoxylase-like metal-dependent hydrolase (beta-lactamase superfamily II)